MTTTVSRPAPPPLEHPLPPCSICGETVDYDGVFYCSACGASWDSEGGHLDGHSSWDSPTLERCPVTIRPWAGNTRHPSLEKIEYWCLRSAGHDGRHYGGSDESNDDVHGWAAGDVDGYYNADPA